MSYTETLEFSKNRFNGLNPSRQMVRIADVQFLVRACGLHANFGKNNQIVDIRSDGHSTHQSFDWKELYDNLNSDKKQSPMIIASVWNKTKNSVIDILNRGEQPYKAIKTKVMDVDNIFIVKDSDTIYLPINEIVFNHDESKPNSDIFVDLQTFHRNNNSSFVRFPNSKRLATFSDINGFGKTRGLKLNKTEKNETDNLGILSLYHSKNWDNMSFDKQALTTLVNEFNSLIKSNVVSYIENREDTNVNGELTDAELDFTAYENEL